LSFLRRQESRWALLVQGKRKKGKVKKASGNLVLGLKTRVPSQKYVFTTIGFSGQTLVLLIDNGK